MLCVCAPHVFVIEIALRFVLAGRFTFARHNVGTVMLRFVQSRGTNFGIPNPTPGRQFYRRSAAEISFEAVVIVRAKARMGVGGSVGLPRRVPASRPATVYLVQYIVILYTFLSLELL